MKRLLYVAVGLVAAGALPALATDISEWTETPAVAMTFNRPAAQTINGAASGEISGRVTDECPGCP